MQRVEYSVCNKTGAILYKTNHILNMISRKMNTDPSTFIISVYNTNYNVFATLKPIVEFDSNPNNSLLLFIDCR